MLSFTKNGRSYLWLFSSLCCSLLVFNPPEIHILAFRNFLKRLLLLRLPSVLIVAPPSPLKKRTKTKRKGTNVTASRQSHSGACISPEQQLEDDGPLGSGCGITPSTKFRPLSGTWVHFSFISNIWISPSYTRDGFNYRHGSWSLELPLDSNGCEAAAPEKYTVLSNTLLFICPWRKRKKKLPPTPTPKQAAKSLRPTCTAVSEGHSRWSGSLCCSSWCHTCSWRLCPCCPGCGSTWVNTGTIPDAGCMCTGRAATCPLWRDRPGSWEPPCLRAASRIWSHPLLQHRAAQRVWFF